MTEHLTPDELAFLQSAFQLAREGATDQLPRYVDQGLPVSPELRPKSAVAIAEFVDLPGMLALLRRA